MPYDPTKPYKAVIQDIIEATWDTPYAKAFRIKGCPYPFIERKQYLHEITGNDIDVDHTDGIGTKGSIHAMARSWDYAVQDALAMNLNDLLVVRARPYKLQNHLTLQYDDHEAINEVVWSLAKACRQRDIILTGGETSIHDNMVGMDLSITVTGFVPEVMRNEFHDDDVLIGLPSTGAHSNGFSFIRQHLGGRRDMVTPTKIYWDDVYPVATSLEHGEDIHGMVHIAGGGFTRLGEYLQGRSICLHRWKNRPAIFDEIYPYTNDLFMYTAFNCGIGMILSVAPEKSDEIATLLKGEIIGKVTSGGVSRLEIESVFSNTTLDIPVRT